MSDSSNSRVTTVGSSRTVKSKETGVVSIIDRTNSSANVTAQLNKVSAHIEHSNRLTTNQHYFYSRNFVAGSLWQIFWNQAVAKVKRHSLSRKVKMNLLQWLL